MIFAEPERPDYNLLMIIKGKMWLRIQMTTNLDCVASRCAETCLVAQSSPSWSQLVALGYHGGEKLAILASTKYQGRTVLGEAIKRKCS